MIKSKGAMYLSSYNLEFPLQAGDYRCILINPLSGCADLLDRTSTQKWEAYKKATGEKLADPVFIEYLLSRGYAFKNKKEEDSAVKEKFREYKEGEARSPDQVFIIPTYDCNFNCAYCYQKGISRSGLISPEVTRAIFKFLKQKYPAGEKAASPPYITLFGGEPLIDNPGQREAIRLIIDHANESGWELAVVTNGYHLEEYIDILGRARVKEVQVTVDGPRSMHDARRKTIDGRGTFGKIMAGVELAVVAGFPINLRVVADKENIVAFPEALPELASFCREKGWLGLGPQSFKTQLGRNYDLNGEITGRREHCTGNAANLMGFMELWTSVARLYRHFPVLEQFFRPGFKGVRELAIDGILAAPNFDSCPACKKEWVYDLHGDIYGCTATCGWPRFKLGSVYPEDKLLAGETAKWQKRNILTIPECQKCKVAPLCGGGCGAMALLKKGKVNAPDCRPMEELWALGIDYYKDRLLALV